MGFFDLIKKAENALFLDGYISHLEWGSRSPEEQLRNLRANLEFYREIKRQKEAKKWWK